MSFCFGVPVTHLVANSQGVRDHTLRSYGPALYEADPDADVPKIAQPEADLRDKRVSGRAQRGEPADAETGNSGTREWGPDERNDIRGPAYLQGHAGYLLSGESG
jgi:hypothetical protein